MLTEKAKILIWPEEVAQRNIDILGYFLLRPMFYNRFLKWLDQDVLAFQMEL
jgi:hypothetical protein